MWEATRPRGWDGKDRGVRSPEGWPQADEDAQRRRRRDARLPSSAPGRGGSDASQQTASHPGIGRHSAASAAAAAAAALSRGTETPNFRDDGDASPVRWELPGTVLGALAQRSSSARTRSVDVPRG